MSDVSSLAGVGLLAEDILKVLHAYCRVPSFTNTSGETLVAAFFRAQLEATPYFRQHADHLGTWDVKGDALGRQVSWAMIRGGSADTVVLAHHSDVVVADNYGALQRLALRPDKLENAFRADADLLDEAARQDLASGQWMFGRGTADMKGGGAIQLALFRAYSRMDRQALERLPTLVLLALPDEENLSAGMRAAVHLLARLKDRHGLNYRLMINAEPHQRLNPENGLISQGSIAKLNLFCYVKGVMAHAGKVLEGVNPTGIMARIVARTDLSPDFVDEKAGETSIPPTWVYMRDLKKQYDVSFPEGCYGLFNILNFDTRPDQVMDRFVRICREEMAGHLATVGDRRKRVAEKTGRSWEADPWRPRVVTFAELKRLCGRTDIDDLAAIETLLATPFTTEWTPDDPVVVVGFRPPYHPGVTNPQPGPLHRHIRSFSLRQWGQDYDNQAYFTGISDLSYAMAADDAGGMDNMMGWGTTYDIPFEKIKAISMDCINIGPWGKDFHKPSERVFRQDLLERTPLLIDHVIRFFGGGITDA